ncbi:unnamed protein product [Symbiodinium natans]|uniref:Uncharacterized protein n=1 Tax=Symbiodinium natans TaxID=878477 RepID=A0A812LDZ4_9DINO|nr:unnamed protein product [Symbiodinium natans]
MFKSAICEVTVASTSDSQDTGGAGVLTLRRQLTASGHRFHASLRLPTLRLVLTPGSWSLLSEVLMSLSQAFRPATDDSSPSLGTPPDIEDLERRQNELVEETPASAPTTSMVQSLVFESAMPASTSTGHFWHELYGLFEADAQLEDSAATEGGDSADFQAPTDADQEEQQALRDAIDSASAEAGQVPDIVGASVEVWVEHAAAMFLLLEQAEASEGQAHFCLGGLPNYEQPYKGD